MTCYHPIPCYYNSLSREPISFTRPKGSSNDSIGWNKISVPCGKCIGCKLDHSRDWVCRLLMEYDINSTGIFLTLTYDDTKRLTYSLVKKDVQNFLKRLRKFYKNIKFKYYVAGEYGPSTFRPHYHMILFGYDFFDNDLIKISKSIFSHRILSKLWGNGNIRFSFISKENIAYCTHYCLKKADLSFQRPSDLTRFGLVNEFQLCSKFLGLDYFNLHKDDILKNNGIIYFNGISYSLPRYFYRKLIDEGSADSIRNYRKLIGSNSQASHTESLIELETFKLKKLEHLRRNKI